MENPILVDAHTHSHLKPHLQLKTGPILPSLTSAAVSKVTTHCTIGAKLFWFSIRLQITHELKIAQPLSKNPSERQRERFVVALMRAVVIGISLCLFCLGGESQLKKKPPSQVGLSRMSKSFTDCRKIIRGGVGVTSVLLQRRLLSSPLESHNMPKRPQPGEHSKLKASPGERYLFCKIFIYEALLKY